MENQSQALENDAQQDVNTINEFLRNTVLHDEAVTTESVVAESPEVVEGAAVVAIMA